MILRTLRNGAKCDRRLCVISSLHRTLVRLATILMVYSLSVAHAGQPTPASLPTEQREQVARALESVQAGITNIRIESQAWVERRSSLSDTWERTPICVAATTWLDGFPSSKARVDVHCEVLEWYQGDAPYHTSSYTITFAGSTGTIIQRASGYDGNMPPKRRATIVNGVPESLKDGGWVSRFAGVGASVYPLSLNTPHRLNQLLRYAGNAAHGGDATDVKAYYAQLSDFNDTTFHIDVIAHGRVRASYQLDPSRGFALLECKSMYAGKDGDDKVRFRTRVNKLKEVVPGIWYPLEATFELPASGPTSSDKPFERVVYRASSVTVNDPNFVEGIFTVPIPEGYLVDDKITGTRYRVGQEHQKKDE